jgi:hypothetical protein
MRQQITYTKVRQRQLVTPILMAPKGKQRNELTLVRRIRLLDRLPVNNRAGNGLTAQELTTYLCDNKLQCGIRTVERDLAALHDDSEGWSDIGVRLHRDRDSDGSAARWSHAEDSKAQLLKALSREDALLLSLLAQELSFFMPASANSTLAKFLQSSDRVLSLPGNQRQSGFRDRVRIIPDGPMLLPPAVNLQHLHEINEALLREEQIDMTYCSPSDKNPKRYRLHPVGLVKQGLFFYLVAVKDQNASGTQPVVIQTFRVDRIDAVARRVQETVARGLPTLTAAIDGGALQFFQEGLISLRLHFATCTAGTALCQSYREAPLSDDQGIATLADGTLELRATVRDSVQLLSMLQAKARVVRVVEPAALRDKILHWVNQAFAFQNEIH